jgi:hypothetical protein
VLGDGTNDMRLDFDRHRPGRRGRELQIERRRDSVGAFCRKGGRRIEQPEISRMRQVDNAVLQVRYRPPQ